jgi:quinol-cytochrome oxidoreductase complex cytochrome b subunit
LGNGWVLSIVVVVFGLTFAGLALVYVAARVYLMVECFINIARLSGQVFEEPRWALHHFYNQTRHVRHTSCCINLLLIMQASFHQNDHRRRLMKCLQHVSRSEAE